MQNNRQPQTSLPAASGNYEPTEVNIQGIMIFMGILLVTVVVAHLVVTAMCRRFARHLTRADAQIMRGQVIPSVAASRVYFPFPREQSSPRTDLRTFRTQEDLELNSYAWIDRKAGIVRIPVDRAMELIAQQGLPVRAGANTDISGPSSLQLQQLRPLQSIPSGQENNQ